MRGGQGNPDQMNALDFYLILNPIIINIYFLEFSF